MKGNSIFNIEYLTNKHLMNVLLSDVIAYLMITPRGLYFIQFSSIFPDFPEKQYFNMWKMRWDDTEFSNSLEWIYKSVWISMPLLRI